MQKPHRSDLLVVPTFLINFPTLIFNSRFTSSLHTRRFLLPFSPPNHWITSSLSFFCSSRSRHARFVYFFLIYTFFCRIQVFKLLTNFFNSYTDYVWVLCSRFKPIEHRLVFVGIFGDLIHFFVPRNMISQFLDLPKLIFIFFR